MSAEESRPAGTGRPQHHHPHDELSVAQPVQHCEDNAVCRISFNIPRPLVSFNGVVYTVTMTVADASSLGRFLLDMASDAERSADTVAGIEASRMSVLERALEMHAAGISVIPMDADGNPAVENWEEFQHRRATEDEIRSWFGPGETPGTP